MVEYSKVWGDCQPGGWGGMGAESSMILLSEIAFSLGCQQQSRPEKGSNFLLYPGYLLPGQPVLIRFRIPTPLTWSIHGSVAESR